MQQNKPMLVRLAWRLLGAFIGLLIGGGLGAVLGAPIAKSLEISNFEGGRGYFVFFALVPLFALSGAVLGAIMIGLRWRVNLMITLVLVMAIGGFLFLHRDQFIDPPPQVEKLGNFELLTYSSESMGDYYRLRYRGEAFPIEGRAGMSGNETATYTAMNSVITFTLPISISPPVFVVNVGDPNNQSYFYLVREVDGQPKVEYLSDTHSNISADWLDAGLSDATMPRNLTLHRGSLSGGRWLLLGDNCVLDVQTLTAYPFVTYPLQDGADASFNQFKLPLGLSPDQHSFVRLGLSDVRDGGSGDYRGSVARLIVFNFIDGISYTLPVDRLRMRYTDMEEINAGWLDHYFEWRQMAGAPDHLVERANFTPLPYHGRLSGQGQDMEYNLLPVKPEMLDKLAGFLENKFAAVRQDATNTEGNLYIDFQIGEQILHTGYFSNTSSLPHVGVWLERKAGQDERLVETVAQEFDQVLKFGVYDTLFLGDPVANSAPAIAGVEVFTGLSQEHTDAPVTYPQTPPVGGKHHGQWINCGVYNSPVPNENAVHSLEHGAVWITYQPELPADQVEKLKALTKAGPYRLLSPYPELPSPIVASAWGFQLNVDNADDPRLEEFIKTYENRRDGPEFGAPCRGSLGEPE